MLPDFLFIASIFFTNFVVGIIFWPISAYFFPKSSDKGYAVSSFLGWLIISYVSFTLSTLRILPLGIFSILLIFLIFLVFNIYIQKKFNLIEIRKDLVKVVLLNQAVYLTLFLTLYFIRGFGSEIYQIERFMDYGILRSLFNSKYLPVSDMWYHGVNLNYYYFGHFVGFTILKSSFVPSLHGFFLLICWIFATSGMMIFRFGYDFANDLAKGKVSKFIKFFSGLVSVFLVLFAGTFHTLIWLYENLVYVARITLNFLISTDFELIKPTYWYADATRFIENTITEMPFYGVLVADLHPHIWAIPIGVFGIYVILNIFKDKRFQFDYKNPYIWLSCFVLGIAYMTNSWDVLTLGSILVFSLIIKNIKSIFKGSNNLMITALMLVIMPVFAYLLAMPWSAFFRPPIGGVGLVQKQSDVLQWLSYWGPFVVFTILYLIYFGNDIIKLIKAKKFTDMKILPLYIVLFSGFFLILLEFFYMKDILSGGDWYRANTVFKISNQLWVWLAMVMGPVVIYILKKKKNFIIDFMAFVLIFFTLNVQLVYPLKASNQAFVNEHRKFTGVGAGLKWWQDKYPQDYEAFLYLLSIQKDLPSNDKLRNIVEAEGDSFADFNFYSTFLGWPTVLGWYGHEWTWWGDNTEIEKVKQEVREIYLGESFEVTAELFEKYQTDYIIIGAIEKGRYNRESIQYEKLRSFGEIVFENSEVEIIEVK